MRSVTIARNYAEAAFELAEQARQTAEYGELLDAVAEAIRSTPELASVLLSPRVPKPAKVRLMGQGLQSTPKPFRLFVEAVVRRGRAPLLPEIASERDRAVEELRREAVDISLAAAGKLIGERFTSDADRRLIEGYLATLEPRR